MGGGDISKNNLRSVIVTQETDRFESRLFDFNDVSCYDPVGFVRRMPGKNWTPRLFVGSTLNKSWRTRN